ncbi:acetylornithine deacetylase [Amaricoccus tamworthensis]|uniref:acetylornithine deacetylase n=1 Tax=Amaricoccus tamworthensis TaxID=57002 RepID=UPI003C7A1847
MNTLEILERLIAFNTVSKRSNLDLIDHVEDFLRHLGARVTRINDPDMPKAGLVAEIGPEGPGVLLSGHTDVVPTYGQNWTRDPFRLTREGDRLYGRGTTDMKGFVASMLSTAGAASKMDLREPLKLVLSYDEEIGCVGIARMIDRVGPLIGKPSLAIIGEPTEMQVATGHKGKRAWRADVTGDAGHSALAPRFTNALNVAADFVRELETIQTDLAQNGLRDDAYDIPYSTVHVGMLSGGRALNIVPDHAEMTFEIRHLAQDDLDELEQRIRDEADRVRTRHGPAARLDLHRITAYPGLETPGDHPVVSQMVQLAQTRKTKVAYGTEAGFFDALGIPTVVCGPGSMEGQGHKADEYVEIAQIEACDLMLRRLLETLKA